MRMKKTGIVVTALVWASALALPAQADTIYVAVKGAKQGQFKDLFDNVSSTHVAKGIGDA